MTPDSIPASQKSLILLSRLLSIPAIKRVGNSQRLDALYPEVLALDEDEVKSFLDLASSNHVIVRVLEEFVEMNRKRQPKEPMEWADCALAMERVRIARSTAYLHEICHAFQKENVNVLVIKSLDHLPDLGSDLDLYTDADADIVTQLMKKHFDAKVAARSWGDRLACKWNFIIPGLPELVEIHVGRLGQTGEQITIAGSLMRRSRTVSIDGLMFRVPSYSDRLMISTLQRMYRHFYFRLCDIIDSAAIADAGCIDFEDLHCSARMAGIWEGVATYLVIVSDYVKSYRGFGIELPNLVRSSARFTGSEIYFSRGFLRVPILPQSARLYGAQLAGVLGRGEFHSGARLSLLPWLATAAVVGQKLTGSDKGIW